MLVFLALMMLAGTVAAQVDDICAEFGFRPSFDDPGAKVPYVYGRIVVNGHDAGAKFPKITVNFMDPRQSQSRVTIDKSGSYCFRRSISGGGTLIVEVDGIETARKSISSIGQHG